MHEALWQKLRSRTLSRQPNARTGGRRAVSSRAPTVPAQCPRLAIARRSEFPGAAEHVGRVRQWLRTSLGACPAADDAVLLASELVTNALEHSISGQDGTFTVTVFHK